MTKNLDFDVLMSKIFDELGGGFRESIYQKALHVELRKLGCFVRTEVTIPVYYESEQVGEVRADMIINSEIVIEFKAISKITNKEINQCKRYLKLLSCKVGYLININLDKYEIVEVNFN